MKHVRHKARKGLTMIEMMGVAVILTVLAAMVGLSIFNSINQGKVSSARAEVKQLGQALELWANFEGKGDFPPEDNWFNLLVQAGYANPPRGSTGPTYSVPEDPWGQPYRYCRPDRSTGSDGILYSEGPSGNATVACVTSGGTPSYSVPSGENHFLFHILRVE